MSEYQVTVGIVSYNPDSDKLKRTIYSVLQQKGVSYQIVVADDGSMNDRFEEVEEILKSNKFDDYYFVKNKKNQGTVKNSESCVKNATGKYFISLSPGDNLSDELALCKWVNKAETSGADIIFANAIYYMYENDKFCVLSKYRHPQDSKVYFNNTRKLKRNYLLYDDVCLGASILSKKDIYIRYITAISGKVKFAEDNIFRLMIFHDENCTWMEEPVVFYEYGSGVSSSGNSKWINRLYKDLCVTDGIMVNEMKGHSLFEFQVKIHFAFHRLAYKHKAILYFLKIRKFAKLLFTTSLRVVKTPVKYDQDFANKLFQVR